MLIVAFNYVCLMWQLHLIALNSTYKGRIILEPEIKATKPRQNPAASHAVEDPNLFAAAQVQQPK